MSSEHSTNVFRPFRRFYPLFASVTKQLARPLARMRRHQNNAVLAARKNSSIIAPLFDIGFYLEQYPDVKNAGIDPVMHYILHGGREGRDPNPLFDTDWYLTQNLDVKAAGVNALLHFVMHGAKEGRDPNPLFDTDWYLARNPDVKTTGINALLHFMLYGALEGRDPHPAFSTRWYRTEYLRQEVGSVNPLAHYLHHGKAKGYSPNIPNYEYNSHNMSIDQRLSLEIPEMLRHIQTMAKRVNFIVLVTGSNKTTVDVAIGELSKQMYPHWMPCTSPHDLILENNEYDLPNSFLVWIDADVRLHYTALYTFASEINANDTIDLIYVDEDRIDNSGARSMPYYKPDWSPDLLESFNYIGPGSCYRGKLAARILRHSHGLYDFVLRFTEDPVRVLHVRNVLCHRNGDFTRPLTRDQTISDVAALIGRLDRTGRRGVVAPVYPDTRCYDLIIELRAHPLVSIIIPTAGKIAEIEAKTIDLIVNCIRRIAEISTYANYEFIVVDNGDLSSTQIARLNRYKAKTITYGDPAFNVAKKLNLGVSASKGEFLVLLNDDVEPISPDWIERLLEHFEKPHVGVAGAKLLYPNGKIQHAGVAINSLNPDHVRRSFSRDDRGYFFSTCASRDVLAVTGACMMTPAALYKKLGGFTEALAVSFNDVDYCLKLREQGLFSVYAPRAELFHFESQSRTASLDLNELHYFYRRWGSIVTDPFYNEENLTVAPPSYEVRHNGRLL